MNINKKISKINFTDSNRSKSQIKYIAIHYVGAVSTAKNNADYFYSTYRGASAHYFVDDNEIWQVVEDNDTAWHVGSNKYYCNARNSNSIGVEMCCYKNNGVLDISQKTINHTIELVKSLMKKYSIPVENVVRHYDVTRKNCPAPFVKDLTRWNNFKAALSSQPVKDTTVLEWQKVMNKVYKCRLEEDNIFGSDCRAKANKYCLKNKKPVIKNDHVKFIQSRLIKKGFSCGSYGADGYYGQATEKAVKAFQKAKKLTADGIVGANTTNVILK